MGVLSLSPEGIRPACVVARAPGRPIPPRQIQIPPVIEQPIDIIVKKKRGPKPKIKTLPDEVIEKKKRGKKQHRMDQF